MDPRPQKLDPVANRVVKACLALTEGEKLVWMEDLLLDGGTEGCWKPDAELGARIGMDGATVKAIRWRLKQCGLYLMLTHRGSRTPVWVPILPAPCIPVVKRKPNGAKENAPEAYYLMLAQELAAHVRVNRGSRVGVGESKRRSTGQSTVIHSPVNDGSLASERSFTPASIEVVEAKTETKTGEQMLSRSPASGCDSNPLLQERESEGEGSLTRTDRQGERRSLSIEDQARADDWVARMKAHHAH